jgi:hypothetical protein
MKCSSAPVGRVRTTFEQSFILKMIDDGDHRARGNRQEVADCLLRLSLVAMNGVENSELTGFEAQCANHLAKLARRFEANL